MYPTYRWVWGENAKGELGNFADQNSDRPILSSAVPAGTVLTNTATIDPANTVIETDETNNASTTTTTVTANVDLSITKTAAPAGAVAPGATLTYTVTATNGGTGDATNVLVRDVLPPSGVTVQSVTAATIKPSRRPM